MLEFAKKAKRSGRHNWLFTPSPLPSIPTRFDPPPLAIPALKHARTAHSPLITYSRLLNSLTPEEWNENKLGNRTAVNLDSEPSQTIPNCSVIHLASDKVEELAQVSLGRHSSTAIVRHDVEVPLYIEPHVLNGGGNSLCKQLSRGRNLSFPSFKIPTSLSCVHSTSSLPSLNNSEGSSV